MNSRWGFVFLMTMLGSLAQAQLDSNPSIAASQKPIYSGAFNSNVAELVKGNGNVMLEFFSNPKRAGFFSAALSSTKEKRPQLSNAELTVDRSQYTLGLIWYKNEIEQKKNFLLATGISFGQEKDFSDVDSKSALEVMVAAQIIPDQTRMKLQAGLKMSNLTGEFKGTAILSVGAMF